MRPDRYFPPRFWSDAYFGEEPTTTPPVAPEDGAYYPEELYTPKYWPPRYFPSEGHAAVVVPPPAYVLTPRQVSLYRHRIAIWRFSEPVAAAGRPQAKSWSQIATDVPCYLEYTESDFGLNAGMLLSEQDMIFTLDVIHLPASVDMQVGDVFEVTDGAREGFWRVRGNEKPKTRRANKQSFRSSVMEAPPLGVS